MKYINENRLLSAFPFIGSALICVFLLLYVGEDIVSILPSIGCVVFFFSLTLSESLRKQGATIFHPLPIVSLIGIWAFGISFAFALKYDIYIINPPRNIDWHYYLTRLSYIYAVGSFLFWVGCCLGGQSQFGLRFGFGKKHVITSRERVLVCGILFLLITGLFQAKVYSDFGGISGFMYSFTESRDGMDGYGSILMIAEAFPMILILLVCLMFDKDKVSHPLLFIAALFLVFFLLKLIFGGLRGSRSNTIWGLFWFAGIVHLWYFRLKIFHFVIGFVFIIVFMQLYSLYKSYGVESFSGGYTLEDTGRFENNAAVSVMLNDFSRSTINAYQLAQVEELGLYDYKLGSTYVSAISKLVPGWMRPQVHSQGSAGAEIMYNYDIELGSEYHNSRLFGAYGEALLNFGPYVGVLSFLFVGMVVGWLNSVALSINGDSPWVLIVPFISNFSFMLLLADADNLVFFIFKNGLLPVLFLFLITRKEFADNVMLTGK